MSRDILATENFDQNSDELGEDLEVGVVDLDETEDERNDTPLNESVAFRE